MKMNGMGTRASVCFLAMLAGGQARGDIVVGSGGNGSGSASFYQPRRFGQSFTATAAEPYVGTVSFRWSAANLELPDPTIKVRLRQGAGFLGGVIATQGRVVPDTTPDQSWVDFVFSTPAALVAGQMYSLEFAVDPVVDSSGGYRRLYGKPSPYAGGTFLFDTGVGWVNEDLCFRVLTVPGPATGGLFGLVLCGMVRRRVR